MDLDERGLSWHDRYLITRSAWQEENSPHITRPVLHFAKTPNRARRLATGKSITPLIRPGEISSHGVHYRAVTLTQSVWCDPHVFFIVRRRQAASISIIRR